MGGVLVGDRDILVRLEGRDDADLLRGWLADERVAERYGGRDRVSEEVASITDYLADDEVTRCIVEAGGRPIAYLQFYPVLDPAEYGLEADARRVWGTDQFIGIPELWGRGYGSRFVRLMAEYLLANGAARVVTDPAVANGRAVRAYEKAGFVTIKQLPAHEVHEGQTVDCLLMEFVRG